MKPISPKDVVGAKTAGLPPEVIDEWNKLIAQKWNGYSAQFTQNELVARLAERMKVRRDSISKTGWLDAEPVFRMEGWDVEYDKPGYNETYEASFTFRVAE